MLSGGTMNPSKTRKPSQNPSLSGQSGPPQPTGSPTRAPTRAPTAPPTRAPTRAPTAPQTSSPTAVPTTAAPTRPPSPSPTRSPTTPLANRTSLTDDLIAATFIPGGLVDTIDAGSRFNVSTLANVVSTYELSGTLEVVAEGIVSMTNLKDYIMILCNETEKSIVIMFDPNLAVGADQLPHIFPLGSILVIHGELLGACDINPSTAPTNLADRRRLVQNAYMVIDVVFVVDDNTVAIFGKTGTFFTMFSSGSLSVKRIKQRRSLKQGQPDVTTSHEGIDASKSSAENSRNLQGCLPAQALASDVHFVQTTLIYSGNSGVDELEATWDSNGLTMTANVTLDAVGTYDMYFEIIAGVVTPGRIDQNSCSISRRIEFLPPILGNFPILSNYLLPEYFFNVVFESPLHLKSAGTSQGEAQGFYYSTRLKYATGLKQLKLSASGSWDALQLKVDTITDAAGRFDAAIFRTPPQGANQFEFFPQKNYTDSPAGVMDFTLTGGMTQNVVVYGSLFSAVMGVEINMGFTTNKAPGFYPPDSTSLTSTCAQCPKVKLVGSTSVSSMTLDVALGYFQQTDLFGPSGGNTPANLQVSVPLDPELNKAVVINNKSTLCLYTKFGLESTAFCIDRCCDSAVAQCQAVNITRGRCVRL
ncbi:hypothetical protein MHU86_10276 [Fragilaria crotonensis]|nr:hypothetical protein MHU86_10276 [Fragilaria crotonensis]